MFNKFIKYIGLFLELLIGVGAGFIINERSAIGTGVVVYSLACLSVATIFVIGALKNTEEV